MARTSKSPVASKKPTASKKASRTLTHKPVVISDSERNQMISEAAYFIAERRGFVPGDELRDWVLAEQEINAKLILQMD